MQVVFLPATVVDWERLAQSETMVLDRVSLSGLVGPADRETVVMDRIVDPPPAHGPHASSDSDTMVIDRVVETTPPVLPRRSMWVPVKRDTSTEDTVRLTALRGDGVAGRHRSAASDHAPEGQG
jgi:hypothetical protein